MGDGDVMGTAKDLVDQHWLISPIFNMGSGDKDFSIAKKHALLTTSFIKERLEAKGFDYTGGGLEFWVQVEQEISEIP